MTEYAFRRSSRLLLFRQLFRKYGWKAIYKQFRFHESRPFSRGLIRRYAPTGVGLEVGVGEWTISPVDRTVLSDHFAQHASNPTIARAFFPAESIPVADGTFAFLLSEHVLEHLPDALRVLEEWKRALNPGGVLFLFLPHPVRTFDRLREPTSFEHFLKDYDRRVDSSEMEHWEEWQSKVIQAGLADHYTSLSKEETLRTNSLHRHVFMPGVAARLVHHAGFEVLETLDLVPDRDNSFCVIARKPLKPGSPDSPDRGRSG